MFSNRPAVASRRANAASQDSISRSRKASGTTVTSLTAPESARRPRTRLPGHARRSRNRRPPTGSRCPYGRIGRPARRRRTRTAASRDERRSRARRRPGLLLFGWLRLGEIARGNALDGLWRFRVAQQLRRFRRVFGTSGHGGSPFGWTEQMFDPFSHRTSLVASVPTGVGTAG